MLEFGEQHRNVNGDARTQDIDNVIVEDAGGKQVKGELAAFIDDRVSGVAATLKTHDEISLGSQDIRDLALAFVSPVGTDNGGNWHRSTSSR